MNTYADQVRQAANPKDAMVTVAAGIDAILAALKLTQEIKLDPWSGDWELAEDTEDDAQAQTHLSIEQGEDDTTITIPPPSPAKYDARLKFHDNFLDLTQHLPDDGTDWADVYCRGGPQWLYIGNRDLFMSYPDATRAAMVADVIEDDPRAAHEMGRDVLKEPCNEYDPNSPAMRIDEGVAPAKGGAE